METQTLVMFFIDALGKKISMKLDDPSSSLIPEDVKEVMDQIILEKVFTGSGGTPLIEADSGQIVTRTVNPLMM